MLAAEAGGLYFLNCCAIPSDTMEVLAEVIMKTAVALRMGQKQKSLWAGDFNGV